MQETKKGLVIMDLILEITRRCNMECKICLRGKKQFLDMSEKHIQELFSHIEEIDTLVFTGGDPSLAEENMLYALQCAEEYGVKVRSVYIVTNAKRISNLFLGACHKWHAYCLKCIYGCDEKLDFEAAKNLLDEICIRQYDRPGVTVTVSLDKYHEDIPVESLLTLAELPHVTLDKYHAFEEGDNWVIPYGSAKENGIDKGDRRPWEYDKTKTSKLDLDLDATDDADEPVIASMYVNAEGRILKYCDYAYDRQEEFTIYNLSDKGWYEKLQADLATSREHQVYDNVIVNEELVYEVELKDGRQMLLAAWFIKNTAIPDNYDGGIGYAVLSAPDRQLIDSGYVFYTEDEKDYWCIDEAEGDVLEKAFGTDAVEKAVISDILVSEIIPQKGYEKT